MSTLTHGTVEQSVVQEELAVRWWRSSRCLAQVRHRSEPKFDAEVEDWLRHGGAAHVACGAAVGVVVEQRHRVTIIISRHHHRPRLPAGCSVGRLVQPDAHRLASLALPIAAAENVSVVEEAAAAEPFRQHVCRVRALGADVVGDASQCGRHQERRQPRYDAYTLDPASAACHCCCCGAHWPPHHLGPRGARPLSSTP